MESRNIVSHGNKRRRVNSSSVVPNDSFPRNMVIILDDTWLEALKHLTCAQWSKMSLICHQVNRIVQRNISRLPRQVIESITLNSLYLSFNSRFTSVAPSLQKIFHPASYIKNVTMRTVDQKLIDATFNGEERYIRCQKFELLPRSNISTAPQKIENSLKWLDRNVRPDSIFLPNWIFNRVHKTFKIRAMLTNFIFDTSQKCKAQELVFSLIYSYDYLFNMKLVDVLIEAFPEMGSFGFASEEIKAAFEKVFNKSRLSSEQMENYKLYLLNYINRFAGNETYQIFPTMGSFGFTSEEIKAAFENICNKIDLSLETFKLYLANNISRLAGTETIQTPVTSTIQGYQRFLFQNVTPQIWYISGLVMFPTTIFMWTRIMRNKHPNVKFVVFLIIQSILSFGLSFLYSIFTNELSVHVATAIGIVGLIVVLLEALLILAL